jgi:hypothetical protein
MYDEKISAYKEKKSSVDVALASILRDKFAKNIIGIPNTNNEARELMSFTHSLLRPNPQCSVSTSLWKA